jgi:phosphoenolpyruvate-protein kinase (PTS system EI component)
VERLKGIGVSSGVAFGPALVAIQRTQVIRFPIAPDRVARELSALERARRRSREQLQQIRRRISELKGSDLAAICSTTSRIPTFTSAKATSTMWPDGSG